MFRLASKRAVAGLRKGSAASAPMPSRSCRAFASQRGDIHPDLLKAPYTMAGHEKIVSPPVVYISGEEMTKYTMELIMDQWIRPHIDTTAWEFFDLSCKARDESNDAVLHDAVAAGAKCGSIFKEPTITPSAAQVKEFGLSQSLPSPNGAMRRGWNGITISRDTIHIEGVKLGFEKPVLFERHAIGGEYGAGWKSVGAGRLVTTFFPDDGSSPELCDDRVLKDDENVVVTYHNPLDNVKDLAEHFFRRCLEAEVVPYVVTKKTVFKWQEGFWVIMKKEFDDNWKQQYIDAGIIPDGKLQHLISDAATMQIIRWTKGGFGMAAHNYDGDMLTDEVAQVHRSPGFITSNLVGKRADGTMIKEFEASHGTVADLWEAHKRGEETSMNPLGMVEAILGAMQHSADISGDPKVLADVTQYVHSLRSAMHNTFRYGQGTRDMAGPSGLTTEAFVDKVAARLGRYVAKHEDGPIPATMEPIVMNENVDREAVKEIFEKYDLDRTGKLSLEEVEIMLDQMGVAPLIDPTKRSSASSDKTKA